MFNEKVLPKIAPIIPPAWIVPTPGTIVPKNDIIHGTTAPAAIPGIAGNTLPTVAAIGTFVSLEFINQNRNIEDYLGSLLQTMQSQ